VRRAPSAAATALVAGKVPVSTAAPFWITDDVEVKNDCCNDGARKPVEIEPRRQKPGVKS
jgi:hypothetical protein